VAARAGAEFQFGRPEDGKPQPVTLVHELGGVDFKGFIAYLKDNPDEVVRREKRIGFRQTITPQVVEECGCDGPQADGRRAYGRSRVCTQDGGVLPILCGNYPT
jgi:hypothetical protein